MPHSVTLPEILTAREERSRRIEEALARTALPLVSFTMNIPGPLKNSLLIRLGFREGCRRLESALDTSRLTFSVLSRIEAATGCEILYSVQADPMAAKRLCAAIEDADDLGRLFDMDVIAPGGRKIDRTELDLPQRGCMVCLAPGRGCASRRTHTVDELQRETARRLISALAGSLVSDLAERCLLDEVRVTPKPGLVDSANTGSHKDMDLLLFERSAAALTPFWAHFFTIGRETAAFPPEETFSRLRAAGREAEQAMFAATQGVNTHKGAIFLIGILCGAIGRLWNTLLSPSIEEILTEVREMTAAPLAAELDAIAQRGAELADTAGTQLYLALGSRGARGEAADGFPSARDAALPALKKALSAGLSENHAAAIALLHLIALGQDTNLHHRGGADGAAWASAAAKALLDETFFPSLAQIAVLDREFIKRNLSPGGCADLLAVTLFLHRWEHLEES